MKILDETVLKNGTKITIYEGPDTTKPHCSEYCVMDHTVSGCLHCGNSFDDKSKKRSGKYLDKHISGKKGLDKAKSD